jgi:hypothetical protein
MGQADWHELDGVLSSASLARGVTAGIAPPPGAGAFVFGYNSLVSDAAGAHGMYVDLPGFTPTGSDPPPAAPDGGCSVRGCVKRVASANTKGFTPLLFACAQGGPPSVNDQAYVLGLSDADPYEIVLAKTAIMSGIADDRENVTILQRSSAQYAISGDHWHHLRLDAIVEPNGDVLVRAYANDLALHPLGTAPVWAEIAGFTPGGFIDDALQIASGSAPLWGGWLGFAFAVSSGLNRRGAFKALEAYRVS